MALRSIVTTTVHPALSIPTIRQRNYLYFSVPDKGSLTEFESWMPDFMKGLAQGICNTCYVTQANVLSSQRQIPSHSWICSQELHRLECFVHFDRRCISKTHWTCLRERPETPRLIQPHSYTKEKVPTIGTFLIPFIFPLTSKPRTQRASKFPI